MGATHSQQVLLRTPSFYLLACQQTLETAHLTRRLLQRVQSRPHQFLQSLFLLLQRTHQGQDFLQTCAPLLKTENPGFLVQGCRCHTGEKERVGGYKFST